MNEYMDGINQRLKELREKAEALLASAEGPEKLPKILVSPELVHELRVHQIELEMQNEELRRTHLALEASRAHYLELYDFAPVGYLSLNAEGIIEEINLTAALMLGMERKTLLNRRFAKFIGNEYKDLWYRHFMTVKQSGGKQSCELPFHHATDLTVYLHLDCQHVEAEGSPPLLRITLTDVTKRKQFEQELRIAAAAFETQEGIIITDANRAIQRVNQAFTRITGYSAEEAIGKTPFFLRSEKHSPCFYDTIWVRIYQDGYWEGEIWEKHKNGELFLMRIVINAVKDHHGQISHYVGAFSDITERERAEAELRIAAAAFETQSGILITDANEVILRVNKAFTRITGYSAQEAVGKTPTILHSGVHKQGFYKELWANIDDSGYWEGEIWNKRKDGSPFPLWQTITAVTDPDGKVTHYVGSFTDITAQKQAEKILLEARERLENQVATTQEELDKTKAETAEINAALNVLLKHRESDKTEAQVSLSHEIEATVLPLLKKLKGQAKSNIQTTRIIDIIEANLQHLMKSYGSANHLDAAYQKLSPVETQVASMVKLGQPTKIIAATLNITAGTVNIHRKRIRKKLGLDSKTNLQQHLQSLSD
jgi:PAS domain S-box-containing protein